MHGSPDIWEWSNDKYVDKWYAEGIRTSTTLKGVRESKTVF